MGIDRGGKVETTADYVIVGAGSAGCALAGRLSDVTDGTVLLVEAGGSADDEIFRVPALWGRQLATKHDWHYFSEPEPGLDGRRNFLPRGKAVGGTGSMNAMLYVRGVPADFDEWESRGASGWGWSGVLPYFKRAESNARGASEFHGANGPVRVSDQVSRFRVTEAWVESAVQAGYPANQDFNGATQEGVGHWQLNCDNAERCSSAVAYLPAAIDRGNLQVMTHAHAMRLVFDGTRAVAVEVERFGEMVTLSARREIILSAGAYNTPRILMISGVGPGNHLSLFGLETVADLPVGENLQDHPGVPLVIATSEQTLFGVGTEEHWERWRRERRGPLASNGVEAGGFFRTLPHLVDCDCQVVVIPATFSDDARGAVTQNGLTVAVEVTRPTSVGKVRLRSLEPTAQPRITHNHCTTRHDIEVLKRGLRMHMEVLAQSPVADLTLGRLRWPQSTTDAGLEQFIRRNALGVYHPSSTCAIGRVVDPELRVYGIDGLRIVDASVMPTQVRGNPNATIMMIGDKAADLIAGAGGAAAADEMAGASA